MVLKLKKLQMIVILIWIIFGISVLARHFSFLASMSNFPEQFVQFNNFFDAAQARMQAEMHKPDPFDITFDDEVKKRHEIFEKAKKKHIAINNELNKVVRHVPFKINFRKAQKSWENYMKACGGDLPIDEYVKCTQKAAKKN